MVSTGVVEELRQRLETLEEENERLRDELATERDRRRQLEAEREISDNEDGLFSGLFR